MVNIACGIGSAEGNRVGECQLFSNEAFQSTLTRYVDINKRCEVAIDLDSEDDGTEVFPL